MSGQVAAAKKQLLTRIYGVVKFATYAITGPLLRSRYHGMPQL